jgi:Ni,Fe-hydrogenase III large subunit
MIRPGHLRFPIVGETILNLKARLWFTRRGIEKLFAGGSRQPPCRWPSGSACTTMSPASAPCARRRPRHLQRARSRIRERTLRLNDTATGHRLQHGAIHPAEPASARSPARPNWPP